MKLYDFSKLRKCLEDKGYQINDNNRIVITEDLEKAVRSGKISFGIDDRINYTDSFGKKHPVYVYMYDYNVAGYGEFPRAHVVKCSIIERFINEGTFNYRYIVANTESVDVRDRTTGRIYKNQVLSLCKSCIKSILNTEDSNIETTEDWYKKYGEELKTKVEIGYGGYTLHWEELSRALRKEKNYTCEQCGVNLSEHTDLLDVHHIDRNKSNNDKSNLIVLCVECHSKQEYHQHNFSSNINQARIQEVKKLKKEMYDDLPF